MEETRFTDPPDPSLAAASEHNQRDEQITGSSADWEDLEKQPLLVKTTAAGRISNIAERKWKNRCIAITLMLGYLSVHAAYSIIGPFFPNEAAEHGSTPLLTGFIISCTPLCVVILSPIFGYYIPQLGARFMLLSGLWLVGGSYILMSFVVSMPSGWVFIMFCILLRLTEGVGSAMFATSLYAQLPELFPHSVGTMTGFMSVAGCVGFAIGAPLGGLLYSVGGFKLPFLTVGGFCFFILFPAYFLMRGSDTGCKRQVRSFRTVVKLLSNFIYLLLVVANGLPAAAWGFFYPTLEPFLSSQFHLDTKQTGLVFLSLSIMPVLCGPVIGKLADKFGSRGFTITGCVVAAASFFLVGPAHFISQPHLWITVVATVIFGLGISLMFVPNFKAMLALAKSVEDSEATSTVVSGIASSSLSLGEFIGPITGGSLTQVMDFPTSAMVFGEVFLAAGCLLLGATVIDRWARGARS